MDISLFDYPLPSRLIADHPAEPRESARLMDLTSGTPVDRHIHDLPSILPNGTVLVVNNTRVLPARLQGRRVAADGDGTPGGAIELTLHQLVANGDDTVWHAFAKPAKRLKPGDRIVISDNFEAVVDRKHDNGQVSLRFHMPFSMLRDELEIHGTMPLPPYIKRDKTGDARDRKDYQTVFAAREGAVAAPTASLHFTEDLLAKLASKGITTATVTLHVGAGTFLPVKTDDVTQHDMHEEWGEVTDETAAMLNQARAEGRPVIAVGTTALRILETAAQEDGTLAAFTGATDLYILPGYQFRFVDRLMTNFHLPRSTLLMLVSALAGRERIMAAYHHAIDHEYRFFSYGDACLLASMSDAPHDEC
ncbi:MAG: tRNA preQ1(34) S-adenosylmethionine ribosyltransferase-isomerase QueA [Pseudomonadota bacterium]